MNMYRIAQIGTFDCENMGDLLFPIVMKQLIKKQGENIEVDMFSPIGGTMPFFPQHYVYPIHQLLEKHREHPYDAIMIGGGDLIRLDAAIASQERYAITDASLWVWAYPILVGLTESIPVLFNAPGVPFPFTEKQKPMVKGLLQTVDYISVRDENSRELLMETGFVGNVQVVPDSITLIKYAFPKESLPFEDMERKVSLSQGENYILFQFNALEEDVEIDEYINAIRCCHEKTSCKIVLMPIGYVHDDEHVLHQIYNHISNDMDYVIMPDEKLTPLEMAALIANSRGFIGTSLHGNIISFAYNIPSIAVNPANLTKVNGFFRLIAADEHVCSSITDVPSKLSLLFSRATNHPDIVQEQAFDHVQALFRFAKTKKKKSDYQLMTFLKQVPLERECTCVSGLYWSGKDQGFSQKQFATLRVEKQEGHHYKFKRLYLPPNTYSLRFDPCETFDFTITTDVEAITDVGMVCFSAVNAASCNGYALFNTPDPQHVFTSDKPVSWIDISAFILPINRDAKSAPLCAAIESSVQTYHINEEMRKHLDDLLEREKAHIMETEELQNLRLTEKEALQKDINTLLADRQEREKKHMEELETLHADISNLEKARDAVVDEYNRACNAYEHQAEELKVQLERQAIQTENEKKLMADQAYTIEKLQGERKQLLESIQKAESLCNEIRAESEQQKLELLKQIATLEVQCEMKNERLAEIETLNAQLNDERAARENESIHQLQQLEDQRNTFNRHLEIREAEMAKQVAQLEEQCRAYDRHIAALQNENQGRLQEAYADRDTIAERVRTIELENAALREANQKYAYDFQLISNSQWWKLTAPGRHALSALKATHTGGLVFKGLRCLKNDGFKTAAKKTMNVLTGRKHAQILLASPDSNAFIKQLQEHAGVICDAGRLQKYLENTKPYQYRVLFVSHELSLTGAPLVLMNFAKMVHEAGNQAVIVSPVDGPLRAEAERFGIPVVVIPDLFRANDVLDLAYPFNLVVACTIASATFVRDLNGMDIPVVWWIHEAMVSYHPGFLMNMPQTLEKNIHVYSVCEYAKDMLLKFRPQYQSNILPYFMDDFANMQSNSAFQLPPHGNKKVFTMVGSMEVRKGQDILVDAIRKLPKNILEKCLFVIVAKPYHEPFTKLVDALCADFPQNVVYYQQLSRDEIANLYKETECLICASRDDPLPCVITEALAVGKPAICSEHTGYAAILQKMNSGLVYHDDDPAQLAAAIEKYISKPTLQKKLQKNTRNTYEKYFTEEVFAKNATAMLNKHILKLTEADTAGIDIGTMSIQQLMEASAPIHKRVSVVIPTYNAGNSFDALLINLEKQKGIDELEIVIVDSGSKDDTVAICKKHSVRLIQITNEQFSHSGARNMGAQAATGDILLFMTQDAFPASKDWIEKLIAPIVNENVAAVSPIEKCPEDTDLYYRVASHVHISYLGNSKHDLLNEGMANGDRSGFRARSALNDVTTAINRKIFMRFMYRHDFAEDLDMGMRLMRSGYRVKLLSSVQTIHGHNRPAGYYFKRTLVDTVTTSETILQMPVAGTAAQWDLAEMLGQGYGAMQHVYNTVLAREYDSLKSFNDALQKAMTAARKLSPQEKRTVSINEDIRDDIMQKVEDILLTFCSESSPSRNEVVDAIRGYWESILQPYAEKHIRWSKDQAKELLVCINKQLACTMGCELARLSPDCTMYPHIHQYTTGV